MGLFGILFVLLLIFAIAFDARKRNEKRIRVQKEQNEILKNQNSGYQVSLVDELTKISELREKGVITEEEFESLKKDAMKRAGK